MTAPDVSVPADTVSLGPNELMEDLSSQPSSVIDGLRLQARKNLYFLCRGVLGYKDVNLETHGDLCRFIELDPANRRLTLMPRGHLKSSIATIGDSLRLALDDPENSSTLICNAVDKKAVAFMEAIKGHFEKNPVLRFLFPELLYERFAGPGIQWSSEKASLPTNRGDAPTWMPIGVGAEATGWHFARIKADDLIGFEAMESPALMERTIKWARNLPALLIAPGYIIDFVGTRWAIHDLYSAMMDFFGSMAVFTRSCIEGNEPIFPVNADGTPRYTLEFFDQLRENDPEQYYSQYDNNPMEAKEREFGKPRRWAWTTDGKIGLYDSADNVIRRWLREELDITIQADPAGDKSNAVQRTQRKGSDYNAYAVTGFSPDAQLIVLESWSKRGTPSEFVDKLHDVAARWKPRVVGLEQIALASTKHYFDKKSAELGRHYRTEPLRPKNRVKMDRIRKAIEPLIATGRFYVPDSARVLRGQIDFFPNIAYDDEIDCVAYYEELARPGFRSEDNERKQKAIDTLLAARNSSTGY